MSAQKSLQITWYWALSRYGQVSRSWYKNCQACQKTDFCTSLQLFTSLEKAYREIFSWDSFGVPIFDHIDPDSCTLRHSILSRINEIKIAIMNCNWREYKIINDEIWEVCDVISNVLWTIRNGWMQALAQKLSSVIDFTQESLRSWFDILKMT